MGKMYYCAILQLFAMGFAIWSSFATNTISFGCISGERNALLKLKASFEDPANRLSSWHTNTDCCTWKGVVCDNNTSHVIGLCLKNTHWRWYYSPNESHSLRSNHLDSSLLELKYLSYLDLSGNDFQLRAIPDFLGSVKQLHHLNLSCSNFSGLVPHNLGNLLSLRVLDLNQGYGGRYQLKVKDLMWASNLSFLEHLDMSGVNLSRAKHLKEVLFCMLPSIIVLRLYSTQINNTHLHHSCVNSSLVSNIQHLDLSVNSFDGEFPCFLHNMTTRRVLDLSENHYNSSSSHAFLRLRNLVDFDLSSNSLHQKADWISDLLSDKCNLKILNLRDNNFYGELSGRLFSNLSIRYCWTHTLEVLVLEVNAFTSPIPTSIGKLRALRLLWLGYNHLSGEFPISLGKLADLEVFDIFGNSFNGTVLSELHFAKLSKLKLLAANSITLGVAFDWVPPFQLTELDLESCEIGTQFPQWLRTQKALETLYLHNCSISGSLPQWFHYLNWKVIDLTHNMINGLIPKLPPYLESLDLSANYIEGAIPKFGSNLKTLILSNNRMDGSIPDSLCKLKDLYILDLSGNRFSGRIQYCLAALQNLLVSRLSSNELSGVIPNSIGEARRLEWLSLSNSSLTGSLPSSLKNCTSLEVLDVGQNMFSGNFPDWIGTHLPNLKFLRLRKNDFDGLIPSTFCRLFHLRVMDLSNNKLTGNISHCFTNLLGMVEEDANMPRPSVWYFSSQGGIEEVLSQVVKGTELEYTTTLPYLVNLDLSSNNLVGEIRWEFTNLSGLNGLNLSHNHLGGEIPTNIGFLRRLESLDLSSNSLHGAIPGSLSDLDFLEYLNLSHNHLSGPIPTGRHIQTFEDPSIYTGNPELCGAVLPKKCHEDKASKSPNVDENDKADDEDERNDKIIFYGIIASGFATGFWGIIGVLVLKRSWRYAFFQITEDMMGKMLGI